MMTMKITNCINSGRIVYIPEDEGTILLGVVHRTDFEAEVLYMEEIRIDDLLKNVRNGRRKVVLFAER
ncbi:hypothetical protein OCU04_004191 [Sclerotinia nivalis]|uniref:Uncharacterized protein n=1 Tax=Sclerotinia nivalis TaxID=352851 RepID=A0A9X0AQS5_9HELO|nr:hypothetical protein OCU04_004191 [Sclerotinia nivalis]